MSLDDIVRRTQTERSELWGKEEFNRRVFFFLAQRARKSNKEPSAGRLSFIHGLARIITEEENPRNPNRLNEVKEIPLLITRIITD